MAERAEESKQALKEVQKQAKGSEGVSLVAVAHSMVDMTRLQESRIEEDMDRYIEFTYQVWDGEKSEAVAIRAMALYLKDTKGLSHHDKVLNQYFDKAEKKIKKEKTLEPEPDGVRVRFQACISL